MTITKKTNNGGAQTAGDEQSQLDAAPASAAQIIERTIEEARRARRKAAGEGKPEISALHSNYIDVLVQIKMSLGPAAEGSGE